MYLVDEDELNLRTNTSEVRMTTKKTYEMIGTISGQRFDAELETYYGHTNLRFLVHECIPETGAGKHRQ